jgi:hypothetical protein
MAMPRLRRKQRMMGVHVAIALDKHYEYHAYGHVPSRQAAPQTTPPRVEDPPTKHDDNA